MKKPFLRFESLPGRKYLLGCDNFVRHWLVSKLAGKFKPSNILDVGGEGELRVFMRGADITTANVKESDISYTGERLPVPDCSFEVVVSLDTLEHLPPEKRRDFLMDLYRVSQKGLIVCAPFGSTEHSAHERTLLDSGLISGSSREFLAEHVRFGLPGATEVAEMARLFSADVYYQGDFREAKFGGTGSKWAACRNMFLQMLKNILKDLNRDAANYLKDRYSPYTNRFYIVVEKRTVES